MGSYLVLSRAVRGMKYNKWVVYKAFEKYVPKADYAYNEKDWLMDNLVDVTNSDNAPKLWLNKAIAESENA